MKYVCLPLDAAKMTQAKPSQSIETKLNFKEIESCRKAIKGGATENFREKISYHIFGDAKDELDISISCHSSNKMVSNHNVANFPNLLIVHGNAKAGLRVTCRDKFRRACEVRGG
jgi:hypothetical protein